MSERNDPDTASWSITEVANLSGVTPRTLRHYDAIGLLAPSWVASSGRRFYDRGQLLRLQHIVLLRGLGLCLPTIAEVLDHRTPADTAAALRQHRERLKSECRRLGRLVRTVDATITNIEKGISMPAEKIFDGFERNPYEVEARQRWGNTAVEAANQRRQQWTGDDAEWGRSGWAHIIEGLTPLLAEGVDVADDRAQELIGQHHRFVCLHWTPDAEAYRNLGQLYVDDERYCRNTPGATTAHLEYLRDAMIVYAQRTLTP
jgi:MerR family transcriptional regulator, thiopeptide resistance regulator